MDSKKIVNSLIDDIANGAAISQILLKAQIIAYNVGDENFSKLIKNEQQGYSPNDDIPDYRKLKSMVKATFVNSWGKAQTVDVHSEMIEHKRIRDLLTFVYVKESLVQVEAMYNNAESGMLRVQVPVFAYPTIKELYKNYNVKVYSANYCFSKESLLSIVENVKAQLLDLLLQFNDKLDWDMELTADKNKDMAKTIINNVYNVKAVVANMGNGNVETQDITVTE
ncbi:AbiTii domain-containing protein [Prevotella sp.]|uniref:AbiTii domain-containing protein n=1 Tax=Prevotella sp. TaxID=59823 RepID=UPI0027E2CBE5|nr:hypothetical protein [Prevotella sp.]